MMEKTGASNELDFINFTPYQESHQAEFFFLFLASSAVKQYKLLLFSFVSTQEHVMVSWDFRGVYLQYVFTEQWFVVLISLPHPLKKKRDYASHR